MTTMNKIDTTVTSSAKQEGSLPGAISDGQATVLFRKIETKHKLEAQSNTKNQVEFKKLYSYADGGERCMLYSGWLFAAISGSLLPVMFFWLGPVFDSFTENSTPAEIADVITEICLVMVGLAIAVFVGGFFQNWFLMRAAASITAKTKTRYLKAILNQESAWYDQNNYLEMSSRIAKETDAIADGIGRKYGNVLYAYTMCLAGFTTGMYKGWSLSLAMFGIAPIMLVGMGCFGAVMSKRTLTSMKAYGQSAGYAEQALSAIRIVVSFGQEDLEIKNYNTFTDRCTESGHKAALTSGSSLGFFNFTIYLCYAYAFFIGAVWIDKPYWNHAEERDYMGGDVISCFFGVLIGLFALGGAGPALGSINTAKTTGSLVFGLIDRHVQIDQDDPNSQPHTLQGEIEFRNVTFYYPTRTETPVMIDFSHTFKQGQTTAIVGPSGSGKSTTIQLVERFYDPSQGQILIDGKPLQGINLRNYRQQIGYVGQEPVMFNMSIKENIKMGKPSATDDEIMEALKAVNAWDFVSKYPNKIDENVGAGGGQLSGGQKQRIALARAFIKKPKMLIFDEATSALDKANEAIVVAAIDALKAKLGAVTTLVIAHRLSTVRNADNIVVMKKGKIAEEGTHDQLVAKGGIYAKLNAADEAAAKKDEEKKQVQPADDAALVAQLDPRLIAAAKSSKATQEKQGRRMSAMPSIDIAETKEVDPIAKAKMLEAQKMLKAENSQLNQDLDDLIDPKKQSDTFGKNMGHYAKPGWMIAIGFICIAIFAVCSTFYGYFIMQTMNKLNEGWACMNKPELKALCDDESVIEKALPWVLMMLGGSVIIFIGKGVGGVLLQKVSENITGAVRKDLYDSIIRKDIGWHDNRDNSAGIMTGTLASDVQLLNGVSSEGVGVQIEGTVAVLTGMIGAFVLSWPLALCTIGLLPIFLICGAIEQKADQENMMNMEAQEGSEEMEQSDDVKESKLLCADSIANYKTVASFGNDELLIAKFGAINDRAARAEEKSAKCYAISLSLATSINNGSFALLYLAMAQLYKEWPEYEYTQFDQMMLGMFIFIFGAFTAAQSISMGPDMKKATKSAMKIFTIMRTPSKVDTGKDNEYYTKKFVKYRVHAEGAKKGQVMLKDDGSKVLFEGTEADVDQDWIDGVIYEPHQTVDVNPSSFKGEIEFKDVWFRYPTRLQQWVFKGLNLKINSRDNIAVVGESGQGKSTFIALVMRFYDPEFGQVLIDGVDVKTMNVKALRKRLGLVQQEPMLFNYSLLENILYGRLDASNADILEAAKKANALEFIQPDGTNVGEEDLTQAFSDDNETLKEAFLKFKQQMLKNIDTSILARARSEKQANDKAAANPKPVKSDEMSKAQIEEENKKLQLIAYLEMSNEDKVKMQETEFDEMVQSIDALVKKDQTQGKFEQISGLVDTRQDSQLLSTKLDRGFEIFAGNRGSKLSGGQKQRIAIARAIIRNPGILLLDEATSALDEDSQRKVQEALYTIMGDRTSIVVAHRLTTVEKCNRLAVIDDGVIVEEGSFSELMNKDGGKFSNLAGGMKKAETKAANKRASLLHTEK